MLVYGKGLNINNPIVCMEKHYENKVTDEFINPSIIDRKSNISDNDGVVLVNFRSDRVKEILDCFTQKDFKEFKVEKFNNLKIVSLFNVYKGVSYAYDLPELKNTFGEYINGLDFKQARIAETEKFPHVTYFFDGSVVKKFKLCDKFLSPSPKVATYDMKPEMNVAGVTESALKAMDNDYDFILVNFANPDMVGHTGNLKATIDAIEICDFCVGKLHDKSKEQFYEMIITADHGNAELMIDSNGNPCTTHTTNKVPFILCNENYRLKPSGTIADVIPTVIELFEIKKPDEMTGESLIIDEDSLLI
jgi:2,3-bisphosphoglycerate-independent phosphoglycerate mutase